ncbi:MAG: hypothetical protein JWN25_1900, partial [Verrucomicrobiales bacterium]|nr:hypothetical protein [Verrucomicrobiales bacterium]
MKSSYKIEIKGRIGIGRFYRLLLRDFKKSQDFSEICFDLDNAQWMPMFPAALL